MHATCISYNERGYIIKGPSGIGKSSLALKLIERGALLVADDQVDVQNGFVIAPKKYCGWMEVRGLGLISGFPTLEKVKLTATIELVDKPLERIPGDKENEKMFQLWKDDPLLLEKFLVIDKIMSGALKKERI